ncbi:hypothetical protein SD70_30360 [Gordoniibacillus kamchatkensis]|uniref:DUF4340 domain-containing protein n=1 Tax=Gordoniibacillus kamchatkensis TaxID=1590651 RepID=A0ABR5AAH4_9BACL|nr:DUF4340 domain-containing protein [Paenibacillus sp. VKM B-2647]KIL37838.1 hypothetical protein SD70_30360 [Paenibacillus sp. VKM B-2647]
MKRLIPTLVLLIVAIGGFWYAKSHNFFREKTDDVKALVTTVKADDVQDVSLQTADGKQTELQRGDGASWTMTKPAALPVDSNSVEGWIDSYNALTYEAKVEEGADLAKYGLDKPKQLYKLTMKNGPVHTVRVGMPLAISGYSYVSVDDGKTVYQVSDQTLSGIGKAPVDFQVKGPVKFDYDKVTSLSLTWKGQSWSLTKSDKDKAAADASWKLGGKDMKGADASPVLSDFLALTTQQEAKPASSFNMTAPDFSADLTETDGGSSKTTKYVGRIDGDNVWLLKQGDAWAYAVPLKSVQDLADKGKQ